jgi:hypothetical protein
MSLPMRVLDLSFRNILRKLSEPLPADQPDSVLDDISVCSLFVFFFFFRRSGKITGISCGASLQVLKILKVAIRKGSL